MEPEYLMKINSLDVGLSSIQRIFKQFSIIFYALFICALFITMAQSSNASTIDKKEISHIPNSQKNALWHASVDIDKISSQYIQYRADTKNVADGFYYYGRYWATNKTKTYLSVKQINRLRVWLRAKNGFDDHIEKRCTPGKHFGFQLDHDKDSRRAPTRMVLDLKCLSVTVFDIDDVTKISTTYFDPSKTEIMDIISSQFPSM